MFDIADLPLPSPPDPDGGEWVTVDAGPCAGVALKVRSVRATVVQNAIYPHLVKAARAGHDMQTALEMATFEARRLLLLDWRGVNRGGVEIDFDANLALQLMGGGIMQQTAFYQAVANAAASLAVREDAETEVLEKNSSRRRAGSSAPAKTKAKGKARS